MATVRFEMAPEDRANAMAEAKARGLPSGWIVELDVSMNFTNVSFLDLLHALNHQLYISETQTS
jgi:hypothetical protein